MTRDAELCGHDPVNRCRKEVVRETIQSVSSEDYQLVLRKLREREIDR